jgi:hypothetical protein
MNAETNKFDTHVSILGNDEEIEFQEIEKARGALGGWVRSVVRLG